MRERISGGQQHGRVRTYQVLPSGLWLSRTDWRHNVTTYEWGAIVRRLLATGDNAYKISAMYLEFANGTPPLTVTTPDRTWNAAYYQSLIGRDYLAVPIRATQLASSDLVTYPNGNQVIFTAKSGGDGLVGLANGLEFSSAASSVVTGAALVAQPDLNDPTQDLVLSAMYFDADAQQVKLSSSEIGIDWELTLN